MNPHNAAAANKTDYYKISWGLEEACTNVSSTCYECM